MADNRFKVVSSPEQELEEQMNALGPEWELRHVTSSGATVVAVFERSAPDILETIKKRAGTAKVTSAARQKLDRIS